MPNVMGEKTPHEVEMDRLRAEVKRLRDGLRDAMEWNWLDPDAAEHIDGYYELQELLDEEYDEPVSGRQTTRPQNGYVAPQSGYTSEDNT